MVVTVWGLWGVTGAASLDWTGKRELCFSVFNLCCAVFEYIDKLNLLAVCYLCILVFTAVLASFLVCVGFGVVLVIFLFYFVRLRL